MKKPLIIFLFLLVISILLMLAVCIVANKQEATVTESDYWLEWTPSEGELELLEFKADTIEIDMPTKLWLSKNYYRGIGDVYEDEDYIIVELLLKEEESENASEGSKNNTEDR